MDSVNKYVSLAIILFFFCPFLVSCSNKADSYITDTKEKATGETASGNSDTEIDAPDEGESLGKETAEENPATFSFETTQGESMNAYLQESVKMHPYDWSNLEEKDGRLTYEDETCTSRWGVDVSAHDSEIDWEEVKEAGASFAFVRVGYRGYGKEGTLHTDEYALKNIDGAQAAGLDVGVYFFSQAVNEEEATEEADLTLEILDGRTLELPVVFDPEDILDDEARTDTVSGEQFTKNTNAFCDQIREAGYEPMIYCNLMWEAYTLDLTQLSDLDIWYADYEPEPQTPYNFTFWQYDDSGEVPGISGNVDLDLEIIQTEK